MPSFYPSNFSGILNLPQITGSNLVPASASIIVSNSFSTTASYISEIEIHNSNMIAATGSVFLYFCKNSGGQVSTGSYSNQFLSISLLGGETVWLEPKHPYILNELNDCIRGLANVNSINIFVRGSLFY